MAVDSTSRLGWRISVIRGYLWFAVVACVGMAFIPLASPQSMGQGLPAVGVLTACVVVYVALLGIAYGVPRFWPALGPMISLMILVSTCGTIFALPLTQVSVAATVLLVPMAAGFLGHRRWILPAGLASMLTLSLMLFVADAGVLGVPDLFGMLGLLITVCGLTWVVERERERWQVRHTAQQAELAEALSLAESAAEARSKFLATMSHEIRTPINGVLGLTAALLESELAPGQRELAQTVHDSGRVLHHVLNDILDLSRLESGDVRLDPRPAQVRVVIAQIVRLNEGVADAKGLELHAHVDSSVPEWGLLDDARLAQVLGNLVSNAVKFTDTGRVDLRVSYDDDHLTVEVCDTGIGIDGVDVQALFEPFVQADASTHRRFGGTGLGLAICARLTARMGGTIGAEAQASGSRFWIRLPVPEAPPRSEASALSELPLEGLRILVAEDHPVNRMVAEKVLGSLGVVPVFVHDGQAAVEAVRAEVWNLVLMDCHMPCWTDSQPRDRSGLAMSMQTCPSSLSPRARRSRSGSTLWQRAWTTS